MSNYSCTTRTNYFRVTDEKRFAELFDMLTSEAHIHYFTKEQDGVIFHGFGAEGDIDAIAENEEDYDFDGWLEKLQSILPEDEAFIYMQAGAEKLRYVTGYSLVVTKDRIEVINIANDAIKKAKEIIGDKFSTQTEY